MFAVVRTRSRLAWWLRRTQASAVDLEASGQFLEPKGLTTSDRHADSEILLQESPVAVRGVILAAGDDHRRDDRPILGRIQFLEAHLAEQIAQLAATVVARLLGNRLHAGDEVDIHVGLLTRAPLIQGVPTLPLGTIPCEVVVSIGVVPVAARRPESVKIGWGARRSRRCLVPEPA
jgi:hypothetical protein